jgi:cell wall-associated NlpC family hydrolase
MKNRFSDFIFSYLLLGVYVSGAVSLAWNVTEETKKQKQEPTAYFDIDYVLTGKALALQIDGDLQKLGTQPFIQQESTLSTPFRTKVNLKRLTAKNAAKERKLANKQVIERNSADAAPLLSSIEGTKPTYSFDGNLELQINNLLEVAKQYTGTRYRYGGTTPRGFDCSGFTSYAFNQISVKLPRSSQQQSQLGTTVPLAEAQPGDLVFFGRKRGNSYRTSHTGIVVENNNGKVRMIHSSRRGVVIDEVLKFHSYSRKFLFVKRVL